MYKSAECFYIVWDYKMKVFVYGDSVYLQRAGSVLVVLLCGTGLLVLSSSAIYVFWIVRPGLDIRESVSVGIVWLAIIAWC